MKTVVAAASAALAAVCVESAAAQTPSGSQQTVKYPRSSVEMHYVERAKYATMSIVTKADTIRHQQNKVRVTMSKR